jgi:glutamate/tyrosine decarboxylase-like PLP-dependent enzyme
MISVRRRRSRTLAGDTSLREWRATPAALAATVLAAAWDQNTGLRVMSPTATVLEDTALRWIRDLLRLQPACR